MRSPWIECSPWREVSARSLKEGALSDEVHRAISSLSVLDCPSLLDGLPIGGRDLISANGATVSGLLPHPVQGTVTQDTALHPTNNTTNSDRGCLRKPADMNDTNFLFPCGFGHTAPIQSA